MLLHRSIGLERFNAMPRSRAIHALYECCNHVTMATKLADARPFSRHDDLVARIDDEFTMLSLADQATALHPLIISMRVSEMLGPIEGWPEYMP